MDILTKLQVKPGYTLKVINKPRGLLLPNQKGSAGSAVLLFAETNDELHQILQDRTLLLSAYVWIAYPKGSSKKPTDLNRDILSSELQKLGMDSVRLIAIDETWSAMRFRSVLL